MSYDRSLLEHVPDERDKPGVPRLESLGIRLPWEASADEEAPARRPSREDVARLAELVAQASKVIAEALAEPEEDDES